MLISAIFCTLSLIAAANIRILWLSAVQGSAPLPCSFVQVIVGIGVGNEHQTSGAALPYLVPCVEHVGPDAGSDEREERHGVQQIVHDLPYVGRKHVDGMHHIRIIDE